MMTGMRRTLTALAIAVSFTACGADDSIVACPGHRIVEYDGQHYVEQTSDGADAFGPGTLAEAEEFCGTL